MNIIPGHQCYSISKAFLDNTANTLHYTVVNRKQLAKFIINQQFFTMLYQSLNLHHFQRLPIQYDTPTTLHITIPKLQTSYGTKIQNSKVYQICVNSQNYKLHDTSRTTLTSLQSVSKDTAFHARQFKQRRAILEVRIRTLRSDFSILCSSVNNDHQS